MSVADTHTNNSITSIEIEPEFNNEKHEKKYSYNYDGNCQDTSASIKSGNGGPSTISMINLNNELPSHVPYYSTRYTYKLYNTEV